MHQDIMIIVILFPAVALMMANFGNRYSVSANLSRHSRDEVNRDNVSPKDAKHFHLEINRLHERLCLIGTTQSCAAISFVLTLGAMIAAYFDEHMVSSVLFLGSILLFTREIQIANTALDVHLSDLESHQE